MILFLLLMNFSAAHANDCIAQNRAQAGEYNAQAIDSAERQIITAKKISAMGRELRRQAGLLAEFRGELLLNRAEQGFLKGDAEADPALFPGGPSLRELPRFANGAMAWDEMAGPKRAAELKAREAKLAAEETSLAATHIRNTAEQTDLNGQLAALKENEIRLTNLVATHNYNAESVCLEFRGSRGIRGPSQGTF